MKTVGDAKSFIMAMASLIFLGLPCDILMALLGKAEELSRQIATDNGVPQEQWPDIADELPLSSDAWIISMELKNAIGLVMLPRWLARQEQWSLFTRSSRSERQ